MNKKCFLMWIDMYGYASATEKKNSAVEIKYCDALLTV